MTKRPKKQIARRPTLRDECQMLLARNDALHEVADRLTRMNADLSNVNKQLQDEVQFLRSIVAGLTSSRSSKPEVVYQSMNDHYCAVTTPNSNRQRPR